MNLLEGLGETTALARSVDDGVKGLPIQFGDSDRVQQKVTEAEGVVELIKQSRDYITALPKSKTDARREVAMARFADSFGMSIPSDMTLEKYQAAMLIGRGLSHVEAADAVGMSIAELYGAMDREFRHVMRFWYLRTFEEYFSGMIRMVDHLMETVNDPEQMIKLLKHMGELAGKAEDRERWETEINLREREIRAREQDADTYKEAVQLSTMVKPQTLGQLDAIIDVPALVEYEEDEDAVEEV